MSRIAHEAGRRMNADAKASQTLGKMSGQSKLVS